MRKAKIFSFFTAIILLITTISGSLTGFAAFTPDFALNSEGVYMVNLDTDIVVVSKNPDKKLYPASTTKIMTCLVALANIKNFDAKVEITYDAFNEFSEGNPNYYGPSHAAIEPYQDNVTYWDCLYALMLPSACEAANIIAYNVGGGSIENFISMMNKTAKQIGCKNTHFANAHGLFNEDNYTTVYDMYLITKYAMEHYPTFMKICSTVSYDMPPNKANPEGYTISHTNGMIKPNSSWYYEGTSGIKTGSIDRYYYKTDGEWDWDNYEPGSRALVSTCQRNGYTYLTVTMGAPYFNEAGEKYDYNLEDHTKLYDWVFDEFEYTLVIKKNEQIMQVDVDKGKDAITGNPIDKIGLVATEDFYTLLPKSLDVTSIQQIRPTIDMLEAPITKGELIEKMPLKLHGETLAKIELVTEQDVELDMNEYYKEKINEIIHQPQFIVIVVILVALIIIYGTATIIRKNHRRKVAEANRRRKIQVAPQGKQMKRPSNNGRRNDNFRR